MDRSNTRNMRGGKARFVQRNHTHFPKSPRVKKDKFALMPSSLKEMTDSLRAFDAKKERRS